MKRITVIPAVLSLTALLAFGATSASAQKGYTFTTVDNPLTAPPGPGNGGDNAVFGINSSGTRIVGVFNGANGAVSGYILDRGIFTTFIDPLAGIVQFQGTVPFSTKHAYGVARCARNHQSGYIIPAQDWHCNVAGEPVSSGSISSK